MAQNNVKIDNVTQILNKTNIKERNGMTKHSIKWPVTKEIVLTGVSTFKAMVTHTPE